MIIDRTFNSLRRDIRGTIDDNLISFINVIFLILIFFMIAGHIEKSYLFQIDPPLSASDTPPAQSTVVILVNRDGDLAAGDQLVTLDELPNLIKPGDEQQEVTRVEIRADAAVDMTRLKQLLARLNQSGVSRISLLSTTY